ncbi:MAG: hypothetical protein OXU61_13165, partial [Gammaproteobacteria bacterium]|nr:hypothetical protein [Gammaproteobacteria bacterium]
SAKRALYTLDSRLRGNGEGGHGNGRKKRRRRFLHSLVSRNGRSGGKMMGVRTELAPGLLNSRARPL